MGLNFPLVRLPQKAAELTERSRQALTGDRQWLQLKALGASAEKPPESEAGLWKNRCRHKL